LTNQIAQIAQLALPEISDKLSCFYAKKSGTLTNQIARMSTVALEYNIQSPDISIRR
jgi:hypothetical protein